MDYNVVCWVSIAVSILLIEKIFDITTFDWWEPGPYSSLEHWFLICNTYTLIGTCLRGYASREKKKDLMFHCWLLRHWCVSWHAHKVSRSALEANPAQEAHFACPAFCYGLCYACCHHHHHPPPILESHIVMEVWGLPTEGGGLGRRSDLVSNFLGVWSGLYTF